MLFERYVIIFSDVESFNFDCLYYESTRYNFQFIVILSILSTFTFTFIKSRQHTVILEQPVLIIAILSISQYQNHLENNVLFLAYDSSD